MPSGGKRPGAGAKKGSKRKATLSKEAAREALRIVVTEHMREMVASQVANAIGIKYLVVREKSTGKFKRVAENAAAKVNPDEEIIEVWEKDPNVTAFSDLMNRALDKPKEQEQEIKLTGDEALIAKLLAGRKRAAEAKRANG